MNQKTTYIQQLANYFSALDLSRVPEEVVHKLKICIFDALECCISPVTDGRCTAALDSVRKDFPGAQAALFRTEHRADAADAAFYNTVKGAVTSRNDTCLSAGCHPGSLLIPEVFALAEENGAGGRRILEAILAGYETMIRFGSVLAGRINRAWRSTAVEAPVGAAFAAARLEALDPFRTASAASFSCHMCSGVNEWAVAGTGEDVFQNGWGARNGILAMRLAKAGAPGCSTILEGNSGLFRAFGIADGMERLVEGLGETYHIMRVIHKPIDSCYMVQNPSQTAAKLLREHPEVRAEDIRRVRIDVTKSARNYPGCANNQHIGSLVQGIMSIALGVASVLYQRDCSQIRWAPPVEPEILDLMRRCDVEEDEQFTALGRGSARVTVFMKNGASWSAQQETLIPLTENEVMDRFQATGCRELGEERTAKLTQLLLHLEELDHIGEVTALLR